MMIPSTLKKTPLIHDISATLQSELAVISEKCTNCGLCQKECLFLDRYGTPKEISDSFDASDAHSLSLPFECSLCRLCTALCPAGINPSVMFLEMRREAVRHGYGDLAEHSRILGYEKRGTSRRYTWYGLPDGCDTVFFPGCSLPGSRPEVTQQIFTHMQPSIPALGLVLDCCLKPSHDLGREDDFHRVFQEMKGYLVTHGIGRILVACPNCHRIFREYGKEFDVETIYEHLAGTDLPNRDKCHGTVTIHDPCAMRFDEPVHSAIRKLIERKGLSVEEMEHVKDRSLCCGEGGMVACLSPDLAKKWSTIRKQEALGKRIITYCAGCTNFLAPITPTSHILDLLCQPGATMKGGVKTSKAPATYFNRLRLKRRFQKTLDASVTRERMLDRKKQDGNGRATKRLLYASLIIGAILCFHLTDASQYLEQDTLREIIDGYGSLAPLIYMLIYTSAPVFFIPGLPITIVGGILFGPLWGVVYTITGSTLGACLSFLISRHLARDWIETKLHSPKWKQLDEGVAQHGWKVVAFTRLIPLFPFNLLNYAFGLTRIGFYEYAVTTFFCMLPACIAFILFSSSLLDLLRGRLSPSFITGLCLVILVSLLPFFYRHHKERKELRNT